jgi:hypothetical protein
MGEEPKREYRVRWRREGRGQASAIRQTRRGADAKIEALRWSDGDAARTEDEGGYEPFADQPLIVEGPMLQSREVGEWEVVDG